MDKVALLFPGQGVQYVGMGKELYTNFKKAYEVFQYASEMVGIDIAELCFKGDMDKLSMTQNAQIAIFTVGIASYHVFLEMYNRPPDILLGHSLGEITALVCSKAISLKDGLEIVMIRGQCMEEIANQKLGGMVAVECPDSKLVEEQCKQQSQADNLVVISNYNSINQTVISGHFEALERVCKNMQLLGYKTIPLKVSAPFHNPIMLKASEKFNQSLKEFQFSDFKCPVISNCLARPYVNKEAIIQLLTRHIVEPVRWNDSLDYIKENGFTVAIDMGPKTMLKSMAKQEDITIKFFSVKQDKEKIDSIMNRMYQHTVVSLCILNAITTKNRNYSAIEYEESVVQPYNKICDMQKLLTAEGKLSSAEQGMIALKLLKTIFDAKKVPLEEQEKRFADIVWKANLKDIAMV